MNDDILYSYARGYFDGRLFGVERCPFEFAPLARSYRQGYDAGVADYCEQEHPEEHNA
jgi:hypothetical protein